MNELYKKSGQISAPAVGDIIILIVGIGVSVLVLIFVGSLGGQTFQLVEADIDEITNESIRNSIRNSAVAGFSALEQTGEFLPLIVLAVVITLVLGLILSFTVVGAGGFGGGGSVL